MQPTNNNLLAEISALVLASLLIITAGVLLFFSKIDTSIALTMVGLGLGIFGYKIALAAPSAAQQSQLTAQQATLQGLLATQQQLQASQQQLFSQQSQPQFVQAPTPVAAPNNSAAMMEQASRWNNTFSPAGMVIPPAATAMPQAMQTTQVYPAMPQ